MDCRFHLLTLQAFTEEHLNPPPRGHGSVKDIVTETLRAFVKDAEAMTCAVGGTVSARRVTVRIAFIRILTSLPRDSSNKGIKFRAYQNNLEGSFKDKHSAHDPSIEIGKFRQKRFNLHGD